jgi:hypothetical protein
VPETAIDCSWMSTRNVVAKLIAAEWSWKVGCRCNALCRWLPMVLSPVAHQLAFEISSNMLCIGPRSMFRLHRKKCRLL